MSKIVMASNNRHKIKEIEAFLHELCPNDRDGKPFEILSLADIGYTADIVEDGDTFEANALIKARTVARLGYIGIADDSGLCVDALNGEPGVYSARYAGGHGDDAANNAVLLKNLEGESNRQARFVCCIACVFPQSYDIEPLTVRGTVEGEILTEYRGNGGFGYDPLFYFPPLDKTLAEVTPEEKNQVSHRANAIKIFAEKLSKLNI